MFGKILIATDFSPASDCLVQCAATLKVLGLRQAVLAHVMNVANTPGLEDMLRKELKPKLELQKRILETRSIEVATDISLGIPARGLEELAARHEVDTIVIGSRGRGLAKAALGSVSFKLLQITSHPVFLSRINPQGDCEPCAIAPALRHFLNILFATDFSAASERSFGHLAHIARQSGADIILLHVHDPDSHAGLSTQELREKKELDLQRLAEMAGRLKGSAGRVTTEWVTGHPAEKIVGRTRTDRFSLVVMGQHGKGFIREALFGSVANEVARGAEAPILFVPE